MNFLIPFLTLIGVLLGWLLNEISQYFKRRIEYGKELKTLLFHLLSVYFFLVRIKVFKEKLSEIIKKISETKNEIANWTPEAKKGLEEAIKTYLDLRHESNPFSNALKSYEECVERMIAIDPFIAIELKRNTILYEYLKNVTERMSKMNSIKTEHKLFGSNRKLEKEFNDYFQNIYIKDSVEVLEEVIKKISRSIGIFAYKKANAEMKDFREINLEDFDKHIQDLFELFSLAQKTNVA